MDPEEELKTYLEELRQPKRKSLKELMLLSLSNQEKDLKPRLGGDKAKKDDFIILDEKEEARVEARLTKQQRQIEDLKDRFVRQVLPPPGKNTKKESIKLKIQKKEEDSQGIEHLVENEVDYVRNPLTDGDEANTFLQAPLIISPQAPGANRQQFRQRLLGQITAQKLKDHEERCKTYAMYNDEEDGEDEKEEEIIEDEDALSDDDSDVEDEEEEEEIEVLLGSSKKKKKKSAFVEDEAEDEDDGSAGDDEDEDDDDDSDSSDDTEDEDETVNGKDGVDGSKSKVVLDELASIGGSEDSVSIASAPAASNKESASEFEDSEGKTFEVNFTPKFSAADVKPRTPMDIYSTIPTSSRSMSNPQEMSQPEPPHKILNPNVPKTLANVISEIPTKFDDLVDLCSGKFVTQENLDDRSQEDDEFANFDFGDDDDISAGKKEEEEETGNETVKTPLPQPKSSRTAVDGVTPKHSERVSKTRLLMQFEEAAHDDEQPKLNEKEIKMDSANKSDDDEENEDVIGKRKPKKQKRLVFSDDEDDENENAPPPPPSEDEESDNEVDSQTNDLYDEQEPETKPVRQGFFFNKHGQMKRKFVEDEAELSGSEEGSADEDEKGLNHYEMEEGDDEELDEDQVRKEVERTHLKRMLDEDDRHIRYLQNQYLENGDLHTDKQRERKFKWVDMSTLNDDAHMGDSDEEQADENPEEASQKQAWIEMRKWMSENSSLLEPDNVDESQSLFTNSKFLKVGKRTIKKIESFVDISMSESKDFVIRETSNQRRSIFEDIVKAKAAAKMKVNTNSVGNGGGNGGPGSNSSINNTSLVAIKSCSEGFGLLDSESNTTSSDKQAGQSSKIMTQPLFGSEGMWTKTPSSFKKGSFLTRGGMMLAKLAEGGKPADAVSNVKNNSRNFVFSHITPPNQEKTDGSTSRVKRIAPKPVTCGAQAKKIKVDRCFNNLDEASKEASIFKWL